MLMKITRMRWMTRTDSLFDLDMLCICISFMLWCFSFMLSSSLCFLSILQALRGITQEGRNDVTNEILYEYKFWVTKLLKMPIF